MIDPLYLKITENRKTEVFDTPETDFDTTVDVPLFV